jgi:hypothetical protein
LASSVTLASINIVDVVPVEIVIVVDGDVAATPVAVAPVRTPGGAQGDASSEREQSITRRVDVGIWIDRRAVNHSGAVLRNVNNLRICWLNNDYLFSPFHGLCLDFLLGGRL